MSKKEKLISCQEYNDFLDRLCENRVKIDLGRAAVKSEFHSLRISINKHIAEKMPSYFKDGKPVRNIPLGELTWALEDLSGKNLI